MTLQPVPDVLGALVVHCRASADLASLCDTRISLRVRTKQTDDDPGGWAMPTYAIVFTMVGGPTMAEVQDVRQQMARIDAHCYGPDMRSARLLWRTLQAYLCPGDAFGHGFRAANCQVLNVLQASGEIPIPEPDTTWPRDTVSYLVQYSEVPTP